VNPEFAGAFKFPKGRGEGYFTIKYVYAAFNKEAEMGEFYMEFEERVWSHKLVEALENAGATQITIMTFANNDGNESASNALARVRMVGDKTNETFIQGTTGEVFLNQARAKLNASRQAKVSAEFDEKTQAALKESLTTIDGKVDKVAEGVCTIIPDYQQEIARLKLVVAHKTKECDRQEYERGKKTEECNKLTKKLLEANEQNLALKTECQKLQDNNTLLQDQVCLAKEIARLHKINEEMEIRFQAKRARF
jgi:hypothetical protein